MKVNQGLFIGLLLFIVFFFAIFFIAGKLHYSAKYQKSYSIKNIFPFELNYNSHFLDNFYSNLGIILSILAGITYYTYFLFVYRSDGLLIAVGVTGITAYIAMLFLPFVSFNDLKLHVLVDAILFVSALANSGLIMVSGYKYRSEGCEALFILAYYLGLFFLLLNTAILINPKLTSKICPIEKFGENGEKVHERPRYIVWAFTEWLILFIVNIQTIISLIEIIALEL